MVESVHASKVLIIFFSLSGQTKGLLENLADGLKESGAMVAWERLEPEVRLRFPLGSFAKTILMMLTTFFRQRVPIKPLSVSRTAGFDLCILAGPTWSYNPSGPVLAFLDRDGNPLLQGRTVLPLISCRGYWRLHWLRSAALPCPTVWFFRIPIESRGGPWVSSCRSQGNPSAVQPSGAGFTNGTVIQSGSLRKPASWGWSWAKPWLPVLLLKRST